MVPQPNVTHSPVIRHLRSVVLACASALAGFGLVSSPGCGTDAKGVEDCREIERARCSAAAACGIVTDVEACQRFYRDHCLHGMTALPPSPAAVDQCVETINTAGSCASTLGPDATLSQCPDENGVLDATGITLACDVVKKPEHADRCSFLSPTPITGGEAGAAGAGN
jgi:hypothetical protein